MVEVTLFKDMGRWTALSGEDDPIWFTADNPDGALGLISDYFGGNIKVVNIGPADDPEEEDYRTPDADNQLSDYPDYRTDYPLSDGK